MLAIVRNLGLALGLVALSACGVTYTSPTVKSQAEGAKVRVVSLTPQSVLVANRQTYVPRSLPDVFYAATGGGTVRGATAIPPAPYVPTESRGTLTLRLPSDPPVEPYRLGVGDVVMLSAKGGASTIQELSGLLAAQSQRQGFTVRDDGAISIPNVGTVQIAGMTLEEAESRLFRALVDRQVDPDFSLEVAEFNSKKIVVGGAVASPTIVPVSLTTPNLGQVLTAAGGLTIQDEEFASVRLYRDGTLYQIPIRDFYNRPELQRTRLIDGDAIYVDTSYDLDRALSFYRQKIDIINIQNQARSQAIAELSTEIGLRRAALDEQRSNFQARTTLDAEKRDYVYLAGEVSKQSRFTLPYGRQATLADVLYDSGGFSTETGNPAHIYVLRASSNPAEFGAVTAWHLNASNAINITIATNMQMRPNDVVFIEEQPITKWGRALRQFFPPLISLGTTALAQ
ncbi:MAG: sugar transporter [Rhodobacteraceae bacterium]|nr:MAG: sugar transporter [Paracoccaceae bacterium]